MPCSSCNENNITILGFSQIQTTSNCQCTDCDPLKVSNSDCVYYGGPNLNCIGVSKCDSLDTILSKIDEKVCAVQGDYSLFNTACLDDQNTITTEQQFVENISSFVCLLRSDLNSFTGSTFPSYQGTVNNRFLALEVPGITCSSASVVNTDSLSTILTKYCTKFSAIDSNFNISGAHWSQCFSVGSTPSTLTQAFDVVIDQICLVKSIAETAGSSLPTFNNLGSCLPGTLTAADTLVDTVNKLKTKVCTLPTYDSSAITWGCITSSGTLQGTLQNIITKLGNTATNRIAAVDSDFTLTPVDGGDPCQGYVLSLSASIADRKFALNVSDSTPGEFLDKVSPGANVTFDTTTTPGTVIINSASGSDEKVKSYSSDPTSGYLIDKLEGDVDIAAGLTIGVSLDTAANRVKITPHLDLSTFISSQLNFIQSNETLRAQFCALVSGCTTTPPAPIPTGTFYLSSTLGGTTITAADPGATYTITSGAFPVSPGGAVTGTMNGTTSAMSITVTGSPVVPGNVSIYKNGIFQECINITSAGTYTFSAITFASTDNMTISVSLGACSGH